MKEEQNDPDVLRIKLDGTHGGGVMAKVTIYTRVSADSNEMREEEYEFPYAFIDQSRLVGYNAAHLIAGFRIIKTEKPNALRELGL
jgi:hypothetical protein